jgi:hypothetical protein
MTFPHTRAALANFDTEVDAAWSALFAMSNEEITDGHVYQVENLECRLGRAVGHAFGLDTAAFNSMSTCEGCVRPGPWLRNLIAQEAP